MAAHKLTKKDMKQDSFVTWAEKALEFLQTNATAVGVVLLVLVVLLVGGSYVRKGQQSAKAEASYMLYEGQTMLSQGEYARAVAPLRDCIEKHGGTESGQYARVSMIQAMVGMGDVDGALAAADQYLGEVKSGSAIHGDLELLRAYVLADAGDFGAAAAALAALTTPDLEDQVYYDLTVRRASWLGEAGETAQALSLLEELQSAAAAGDRQVPAQDLEKRLEVARIRTR